MPRSTRTYRIFVASPGDVQRERDAMLGIVNEMNRILDALLPDDGIRVELIRWEIERGPPHRGWAAASRQCANRAMRHLPRPAGEALRHADDCRGIRHRGGVQARPQLLAQARHPVDRSFLQHKVRAAAGPDEQAQLDKVKAFRAELGSKRNRSANTTVRSCSRVLSSLRCCRSSARSSARSARCKVPCHRRPDRSTWSIAGQPVPIGTRVKIVDIGEKDACYHWRRKYIGKTGVILEALRLGQWLRGTFLLRHAALRRGRRTLYLPAVPSRGAREPGIEGEMKR